MLALAADVEYITNVMNQYESFHELIQNGGDDNKNSIEIKSKIKKLMTSSDVTDCLNRLVDIQNGQPVWGLSTSEREIIMLAREKVNEC